MRTQKNNLQYKIIAKAKKILKNSHNGIRQIDLAREIQRAFPDIKFSTIRWYIWNLHEQFPDDIEKPERGLFILKKFKGGIAKKGKTTKHVSEEAFYDKFAEYLVGLDECTSAISLGGKRFQDKWGTPDVFGLYKFSDIDPIKPPIEIVSAEIKSDTNQLISAFGQACAYKLFSHKVYLVVPKNAAEDIARLEFLCLRFGIGLILFDNENSKDPKFEIRTRAIKSEPDYFYVNEYLKKLKEEELKNLGL